MKRISILLIILILINIQCKSQNGFLTASLVKISDGTLLKLIDWDSGIVFREVKTKDGKFELEFNIKGPKKFVIEGVNPKYPKDRLFIWLENSKIEIHGDFEYLMNAKVEGSSSNIIHKKFEDLNNGLKNKCYYLQCESDTTRNQLAKEKLKQEIEHLKTQYKTEKINLYSEQKNSKVALHNLFWETIIFDSVLDKSDIAKLYNKLPESFKLSDKGARIKKFISYGEAPQVGQKYVDCSQLTPDGKVDSISNHLGKYTIIDFWASSCGPCRAKHPSMRKLYAIYHEKGLNIISISGDSDRKVWKEAILKDSLPWINISELKGVYNEAFIIYNIKYIPQMILLDKDGIIIDNKLGRYFPLELQIAKLFD